LFVSIDPVVDRLADFPDAFLNGPVASSGERA
jgi:hypothetical protein